MTQRQKLEIQLNQPTKIELLYDEPVEGTSNYGPYYLYAVKCGNSEYSYFAPEQVHQELKNYRKGDIVNITKLAAQHASKIITRYVVEKAIKEPIYSSIINTNAVNGNNTNPTKPLPADENTSSTETIEDEDDIEDFYYNTMLRSYRQAIAIQAEIGSFIDIERAAVTLFIAQSKSNGNGYNSQH